MSPMILVHMDDERAVEIHARQAQGTLPSAFAVAVFYLVEMLEDEEILEHGATGLSDVH